MLLDRFDDDDNDSDEGGPGGPYADYDDEIDGEDSAGRLLHDNAPGQLQNAFAAAAAAHGNVPLGTFLLAHLLNQRQIIEGLMGAAQQGPAPDEDNAYDSDPDSEGREV